MSLFVNMDSSSERSEHSDAYDAEVETNSREETGEGSPLSQVEQALEDVTNARKLLLEKYIKDDKDSIFKYPGLKFLRFRLDKIKFTFTPSDVAETSKRFIFYCTLRYKSSYWLITRNSFPVDVRPAIYRLFYTSNWFAGSDKNIIGIIHNIYMLLVKWSDKEENFRKDRYQRFRSGEDIELFDIEEEMFLTKQKIREIHEKRQIILRRMIPPNYRD